MKREILINANPRETRVAIIEDDQLSELLVDRPEARRMVGDIYFGRVDAVLPGIQAAFVDIGTERVPSSTRRISSTKTTKSPTTPTTTATTTMTPKRMAVAVAADAGSARTRKSCRSRMS